MLWLSLFLGAAPAPKIIDGELAGSGYPAVGVAYDDDATAIRDGTALDGISVYAVATLIAPDVLLTAAHAVSDADFEGGLQLAWANLSDVADADGTLWIDVAEVILHPGFSDRPSGVADPRHDIALLLLATPVADVAPLLLADRAATEAADDTMATVVGYGPVARSWTEPEEPCSDSSWGLALASSGDLVWTCGDGIKRYGALELARSGCKKLVLKAGEQAIFIGDSGGPVLDREGRLLGLISGGTRSSSRTFITRADTHLDWIDAELRAACSAGRRAWCDEPGIDLDDADNNPSCCASARGSARLLPVLLAVLMLARRGNAQSGRRADA